VVPHRTDDPGHTSAATITFGPLARANGANPSWDGVRCSSVYCHGGAWADANASVRAPAWRGGAGEARCGACHGAPPASHPVGAAPCVTCHPANAPHVDGHIQLVGTSCTSCHGGGDDPAPPEGAHEAHLRAPRGISAPIACATCHVVPTSVLQPGHVLGEPARVVLGGLAVSGSWDRASGTCANTWCHGASSPPWTSTGTVGCGTCHGLPPADHDPSETLGTCATCHPDSVDGNGNILLGGKHLNGVIDAR
jgi:predicted CxxxxCH...CXXCH cytochrome family protein